MVLNLHSSHVSDRKTNIKDTISPKHPFLNKMQNIVYMGLKARVQTATCDASEEQFSVGRKIINVNKYLKIVICQTMASIIPHC